ncbi:Retrovirus-related Pol polyprotein from transposon [Trichinella murrelli]|uniref:Retrovirus-related Pol polyprotein from transposon n=1 Tax=Trichinella murrelli TaxID=144512 RepID=A0A0V0T9C1_9BILA|nr:Retrovirus-related Pol polyprotein from transposon [Trichinella murrelli]
MVRINRTPDGATLSKDGVLETGPTVSISVYDVKPEKCRLMKRRVAYLGHIISEKGIAGTDLRVGVAAVPVVVLPQIRQRLCECRCPVTIGLPPYICAGPRLSGLPSAVHRRRGRHRRRPWGGAEPTAERRYCAIRRGMLSLVWTLREFHPYLYGQRFLVRTDHSCLRCLTTFKEREWRVARWLESLAHFDFEVEHRAGRLHGNADALSRTSYTQCGRLVKGSACAVQAAQLRTEDVAQSFKDQLLAAQQADPEIQLLRQWLVGASWPVECHLGCSRDMHMRATAQLGG